MYEMGGNSMGGTCDGASGILPGNCMSGHILVEVHEMSGASVKGVFVPKDGYFRCRVHFPKEKVGRNSVYIRFLGPFKNDGRHCWTLPLYGSIQASTEILLYYAPRAVDAF